VEQTGCRAIANHRKYSGQAGDDPD